MKLSIVMATFYKKDGSTYIPLERALTSIKNQTHQDYFVYLIGDKYEKNDEFIKASKIIDSSKIKAVNLPNAPEREKYSGRNLWVCGGCNAYNTAIKMSQDDGLNYICHLDHDDYWLPNHLEIISKAIEQTKTNFVCTLSETPSKNILPKTNDKSYIQKYIPGPSQLIHSSSCVNFAYFNMKYRNMIEECNSVYPSDADLWSRIQKFLKDKNETGILLNIKTVIKDSGMSVIKQ